MPEEDVKSLSTPRASRFDDSYEQSLTETLDTARQAGGPDFSLSDFGDQDLRSFVGDGEDFFEDEAIGRDDAGNAIETRANVIINVRRNILQRMREENAASDREAREMKQAHDALTNHELMAVIDKLKAGYLKKRKDELEIRRIKGLNGTARERQDMKNELVALANSLRAQLRSANDIARLAEFGAEEANAFVPVPPPAPAAPAVPASPAPSLQAQINAVELHKPVLSVPPAPPAPAAPPVPASPAPSLQDQINAVQLHPPAPAVPAVPLAPRVPLPPAAPDAPPAPAVPASPAPSLQDQIDVELLRRSVPPAPAAPLAPPTAAEVPAAVRDQMRTEILKINNVYREIDNPQPGNTGIPKAKGFLSLFRKGPDWHEYIQTIEQRIQTQDDENTEAVLDIKRNAAEWIKTRKQYAANSVKKHYATYDNLAKSYYELTHEFSMTEAMKKVRENREGLSPMEQAAAMARVRQLPNERTIPADAAKNIIEYTGIYNRPAIDILLEKIKLNPHLAVSPATIPVMDYKRDRSEDSPQGAIPLTKAHRKIVMESLPDAANGGLRTRYKFGADFRGRAARRQYMPGNPGKLRVVRPPRGSGFFREVYAEAANLPSDERDISGRFLHSERSAEILSARRKARAGAAEQDVHGFFLNGEFFTDETGLAPGTRVSTKEDMAYYGRWDWDKRGRAEEFRSRLSHRDWEDEEKAEKLRTAIRMSPFFQHVNSRSIQYYAGYNIDEDFARAIEKKLTDDWTAYSTQNPGQTRASVITQLAQAAAPAPAAVPAPAANLDQQIKAVIDSVGTELRGDLLAGYIAEKLGNPGNQPFDPANPAADPVYSYVLRNEKTALFNTAKSLLARSNRPDLWKIARNILKQNNSLIDWRTRIILDKLPPEGELMRVKLLEELVRHQGWFSEYDPEDSEFSVLSTLVLPWYTVWKEGLMSRRGYGAWFKRNLVNGMFIKKLAGYAGALGETIDHGMDSSGDAYRTPHEADFESAELWTRFMEAMGESNQALNGAAAVLGITMGSISGAGASEGAATASDATAQFGSDMLAFAAIVNNFVKLVVAVKDLVDPPEDAGQGTEPVSLDVGTSGWIPATLDALEALNGLLLACQSIVGGHMSADTGTTFTGKVDEYTDNWFKPHGYLENFCFILKNLIGFTRDCIDVHNSRMQIDRTERADLDLERSIRLYEQYLQNLANPPAPPAPAAPAAPAGPAPAAAPNSPVRAAAAPVSNNPAGIAPDAEIGREALAHNQVQYLMYLMRANAVSKRTSGGFGIAIKALNMGKGIADYFEEPISKAVLTIVPKALEFVEWIARVGTDRYRLWENIESMLGDRSFLSTPYFNEVLRRETGIVNKHYLVDLARIFMAIDTHIMIRKPDAQKNEGERRLAKIMLGTLYGNIDDRNMRKVKLSDLMAKAGLDKSTDWRSLLRFSLTDKKDRGRAYAG